MHTISVNKKRIIAFVDSYANQRDKYIKRNNYYYKNLINFFNYNTTEKCSILEIGCGTGYLLHSLKPVRGVGIDLSGEMVRIAKENYPECEFIQMDAENITLKEKFDFIIISDTLYYIEDIQKMFRELKKVCHADTRIIISYHNSLWQPLFLLAELLRLKMPQQRLNWLNRDDIFNLLYVEGFDMIKSGKRFIFPKFFPVVSWFFNKYIASLPLINNMCIAEYIIARLPGNSNMSGSVSIIIPARNEKGNIEDAVKRISPMGKHMEIIFVEGHSTDGTLEEIKRVCKKYVAKKDIKYTTQDGEGKGDAVRKGFAMATGDILMILDADLTVPPEDLPKFYSAINSGKGEYINGTRLVYPMEKEAMRILNMMGNKFFSIMFSWLLGQRLKDTLCGTKVISKKNWERLVLNRKYFGDFDPFGDFDLIFGAAKLNLKIVEVPIRYRARIYGDTNISRFKHGWLLLKMVAFAMNKIKFI